MKKVSIIIATYNRKKFLKTAIKSALMQTYQNIEIIVVDDNSDYDIEKELFEYKDKIKLIKNKKNLGCDASYNIGIKASNGEYITILDDDDIFHPTKIERQMKIFQKNPKLGLVYCPIGVKIGKKIVYRPPKEKNNYWNRLAFKNDIGISPLIRKDVFEKSGFFDESLVYHGDRDMWYRIGKKFEFGFDKEPCYIVYNKNINRMSSEVKQIIRGKEQLYEKHKKNFKNKRKYYSDFYYELAYEYLSHGLKTKFFKNMIKAISLSLKKITGFFIVPYKLLRITYKSKKIDEKIINILIIN
jgi:glycosyltransferase involved in cell wall biosynthesis